MAASFEVLFVLAYGIFMLTILKHVTCTLIMLVGSACSTLYNVVYTVCAAPVRYITRLKMEEDESIYSFLLQRYRRVERCTQERFDELEWLKMNNADYRDFIRSARVQSSKMRATYAGAEIERALARESARTAHTALEESKLRLARGEHEWVVREQQLRTIFEGGEDELEHLHTEKFALQNRIAARKADVLRTKRKIQELRNKQQQQQHEHANLLGFLLSLAGPVLMFACAVVASWRTTNKLGERVMRDKIEIVTLCAQLWQQLSDIRASLFSQPDPCTAATTSALMSAFVMLSRISDCVEVTHDLNVIDCTCNHPYHDNDDEGGGDRKKKIGASQVMVQPHILIS